MRLLLQCYFAQKQVRIECGQEPIDFPMSLHISMTEEADQELQSQKKRNLITASATAFLSIVLGGLLLYTVVIVVASPETPEVVAYVASDTDGPPNDNPVTPERVTTRPSASVQNHASVITSNSASDVAIASVDIETPDVSDLGQSLDLGVDFGAGVGDDLGTEGGGFGTDKAGGSTLVGTFYDFKQTQAGKPTDITPAAATLLMKEFLESGWKESKFAKYYKSPTKLYNSHIFITRRSAKEAPKAFKCENKVKDSRWCAIYRGKVVAPKSGKFRFVGAGDDALVVRFNGEEVFDYGWYMLSVSKGNPTAGGEHYKFMIGQSNNAVIRKEMRRAKIYTDFPVPLYKYSGMNHWNNALGGLAAGKTFEVHANVTYPIEILVSEIPGGEFGAVLLIEEIGAKYTMDKNFPKSPILTLFRTNYANPEPAPGEAPPFDPVGIVWPVVK